MKKNEMAKLLICVFLMILTGCNSSIESDAQKMADMQCKSYNLLERAGKGEVSISESTSFAAEFEIFNKEMMEKYASDPDKKKFEETCLKAVAKGCK